MEFPHLLFKNCFITTVIGYSDTEWLNFIIYVTFFISSWLVVFYTCRVNFLGIVIESHGMARHVPDPSQDTPLYLVIMSPHPCLGYYCSSDSVFDDCHSFKEGQSGILYTVPQFGFVWIFFRALTGVRALGR